MFNKKNLYRIVFIFLAAFFVMSAVPYTYAKDTGVDCHKDDKFRVKNRSLLEYYSDWKDSVHDLAGVKCTDCHGGNPNERDKKAAHKDHFSSLTAIEKASFKLIPQRCGKCHEEVLKYFAESKHYKALLEKETGPHCSTCHGSMNAQVYYTSLVTWTCKECHNEYTKNRPEVVGEADKILHRINVSRAFMRWVSDYYSDKEPEKVKEINAQYKDLANSWHKFDFAQLDKKSHALLHRLKSLVNRRLSEKRKKAK
jgi:ribosomal protein L37AE/L43A